jgi:hypothetical protein
MEDKTVRMCRGKGERTKRGMEREEVAVVRIMYV